MRRRTASVLLLGLATACSAAPVPPEHVVLITVDTLRADRLGVYGDAAARTPQIDALAAGSLRFERAYAHASSTLPSLASLMTGLLPAQHGSTANVGALRPDVATLATLLGEHGFASAGFVGSYVLRPERGLARGFAHYTREYGARESNRAQPENRAASLTDAAIAWLDARPQQSPFLLWVHYQEPHGPYAPPAAPPAASAGPELPRSATQSGRGAIPRYQWLGHGRLAEYEARYAGEIAEVDRQLGRLLAALHQRGLFERSVVVFTADHGEAFGEEDLYCAHGEGLQEVLLRVPLLLRAPGLAPGVRRDAVRLIDVVPTVLALLGLPDVGLPGRSLLEEQGDRPLVAQVSASGGRRWRSVREAGFELREGDDGSELRALDVRADAAPPAGGLRQRLAAQLVERAPWPAPAPQDPLPAEERDALRALGYAE